MTELLKKLEAAICEPDSDAPSRERAYAIEIDGETWTAMTDGHVLVALRGAGGADPASTGLPPAQVETFRQLVGQSDAVDWAPANGADLLAWIKSHPVGAKMQRICSGCHGLKVTRCECDCGECWHEADCPTCEGTGTITDYPDPVRAWVHGVYLDLNLLNRAIEHVATGPCEVARGKHSSFSLNPFDCLHLRSEAWRVTIMGTNESLATGREPAWSPEPAPVSP